MREEPARPEPSAGLRPAIEAGPLLVFLLAYMVRDLFAATAAFMGAFALALVASRALMGRVPAAMWFSAALVTVMGLLTLALRDETFIKMKPTVLFGSLGGLLAVAGLLGRNILQRWLGPALPGLAPAGWAGLQWRWSLFLLALALTNEVLWRSFPTTVWVHFKTWGDTALTLLFAAAQLPFLRRHGLKLE